MVLVATKGGIYGVGEEVIKPYAPTTLDSDLGYFELVIKLQGVAMSSDGMLMISLMFWIEGESGSLPLSVFLILFPFLFLCRYAYVRQ
ncbi:putative NADH--cytochrome b5 reductase 1 [Iris pallida]|uniref:NADH--cytochrome b5 reductase 1 n=1 Tax=Iris pallida TaxID=29817 RepID=A0AAX6HGU8_IRIPA|nr:putative NADH--cytochrome b5 reductase 1 [Iris pallida]KAJ6826421.1 putative NADH--cytochrome b5 reductase 1 [Iris pallida]KAJ6839801.1 putative NADH--cytochrome b5 reductase 1 [Iris pallida]